jgi:UDP-glucose 4-epimerase
LTREGRYAIRIIDNLSVGSRDDLRAVAEFEEVSSSAAIDVGFPGSGSVQLVTADILDDDLALHVARDADVIVHLAANTGVGPSVENPRADCITNVVGTLNYLEAARHNGVACFVFASSGAPVGECIPPLHEELAPHPVSPYGASKLAGEGYCSVYYRTFGVRTISLRFGNVYGPNSSKKNSVVAKFIRNALAGEGLEIFGDGNQTRDFIYVRDLIDAITLAVSTPISGGETFQIASNSETTIAELATLVADALEEAGVSRPFVTNGDSRVGDVRRNYSDTSKAKRLLGWHAKTSLRDGLRTTVDWFIDSERTVTPVAMPVSR